MPTLETELQLARDIDVDALADHLQSVGFACQRCGGCCTAEPDSPHTAVVFPDEIRKLMTEDRSWEAVARPMPYGLEQGEETFEWALQTDDDGHCRFYDPAVGCTVYENRPLICRTYPFSINFNSSTPEGPDDYLQISSCGGVGSSMPAEQAYELAATLQRRAIREREEAIAVRDTYNEHSPVEETGIVVYDSEAPKRPDGTPVR